MTDHLKFYIDGEWVDPAKPNTIDVINPATEEPCARISLGSEADVDKAVAAAKAAFPAFSRTTKEQRIALLEKILEVYKTRYDDIAKAISMEMGAPITLAMKAQAATGVGHLMQMIKTLKEFEFESMQGHHAHRA
jgi:aldehyde dehydrogenase (NAD+)